MQFDHIGMVTGEEKPDETFVAPTRVWITDFQKHPYRVEWLRFEPDSPVTGPVRELPHVAYRVDDIEARAKGLDVLLEPFDAGMAVVGFYRTADGAVIEFMKYHDREGKGPPHHVPLRAVPTRSAHVQFDHAGMVTAEKKAGEAFVPATRVWRTDPREHPFRVEWLRFEPDSPVTGPVRETPHVAYRVDDIPAAAEGMKVLLEPFDVGPRVVAFFQTSDGAVVEFVKYKDP